VSKRTTGAAGTDAASVAPAQNEPRTQAARAVTDDDAFFDLWLRAELHETFDAVVAEPIPDDLLRLIEEDRGERDRIRRNRARGRGG
jgi:hypothetical protein